jgi:hypothetical protein
MSLSQFRVRGLFWRVFFLLLLLLVVVLRVNFLLHLLDFVVVSLPLGQNSHGGSQFCFLGMRVVALKHNTKCIVS